jgi:hypothetical protein
MPEAALRNLKVLQAPEQKQGTASAMAVAQMCLQK